MDIVASVDGVLQSCMLLGQCCFDIVAGMDGDLKTVAFLALKK